MLYGTIASACLIRWTQLARGVTSFWPAIDVTWVGPSFFMSDQSAGGGVAFLLVGCLAAAVAAALAESLESTVDDNILVPVAGGAVLWAAALVSPSHLVEGASALVSGLMWGVAVTTPFAVLAYGTQSVDRAGAFAGLVIGTLLYGFAGWPGFALLILLVVGGVGMTRLGHARKVALDIAQESGGRRGAGSAFANTGAAVAFAFLAVATPSTELFTLAMVAAFATALFDTTATEVGKAFGRRHYRVPTLQSVPAGTGGAVSVPGTVAGALAAVAMALLATALGLVAPSGAMAVVTGAFVGSMTESLLASLLGDRRGSDNEVLNLTNTLVGAGVAVALLLAFS